MSLSNHLFQKQNYRNHFQQTYTAQVQKVIEPVFARLGVKATAHNIGMGGLGTLQNAMGAQSIYGRDIDYLIWDSGMTEKGGDEIDLFFRQSILGSTNRVPYISAPGDRAGILRLLHDHADVDAIVFAYPSSIPETTDEVQALTLPWAARYIFCSSEMHAVCRANRYNGTCWIARPDGFEPPTKQAPAPGGRASWHPGHREHQLTSRIIAYNILNATNTAINRWLQFETNNFQLPDDLWHVTTYYNNIRSKLMALDPSIGFCHSIAARGIPADKLCKIPFKVSKQSKKAKTH